MAAVACGAFSLPAGAERAGAVVQVDLASGTVLDPLPFDVPFVIKGTTGDSLPKDTVCVETTLVDPGDGASAQHLEPWEPLPGTEPKVFYVRAGPLEPNTAYELRFTVVRRLPPEELGSARATVKNSLAEIVRKTSGDPTSAVVQLFSAVANRGAGLCKRQWSEEAAKARMADFHRFAALALESHSRVSAHYSNWKAKLASFSATFQGLPATAAELAAALSGAEEALHSLRLLASFSAGELDLLASGQATLEPKLVRPAVRAGRRLVDESSPGAALAPRIQALERSALTLREIDALLRQNLPKLVAQPRSRIDFIKDAAARLEGLAEELLQMAAQAEARDKAIDAAVERGGGFFSSDAVTVVSPRKGSYKGNASVYISLDLGLSYFPEFQRTAYAPYAGANIYFRPVNKEAYLNVSDFPRDILRRLALLVGTTITSIEETDRRKGLFGYNGLLLGLGMRVQSYIRVSGGAVLFRALNPNPLEDKLSLAASPFMSTSIDLDVADLFGGVRTTVFGAK